MQIDIRSNIFEVQRQLDDVQRKQVPFATVLAMTLTARDAVPVEQNVMRKVFNNPTPYAINALRSVPATKRTMIASVEFKEFGAGTPAKRFLNPEIHGGPRSRKSSERQMAPLMGGHSFVVPAKGTPRDAYGNVSGSTFRQILSQLKVSKDPAMNANEGARSRRKRKNNQYFIPKKGGMVMLRNGAGVKPVLIFTRAPIYRKRFPFYETASQVVKDRININFEIAFQRTMANSGYKSARGMKWRF